MFLFLWNTFTPTPCGQHFIFVKCWPPLVKINYIRMLNFLQRKLVVLREISSEALVFLWSMNAVVTADFAFYKRKISIAII